MVQYITKLLLWDYFHGTKGQWKTTYKYLNAHQAHSLYKSSENNLQLFFV